MGSRWLVAGFGVGTTTVYRYFTEAVGLLAFLAPGRIDAVRVGEGEPDPCDATP
ncbi:hypothetical protein [Streptomyces sp. NBC_01220]|uniref:hypothetical protein n=1 Tax=Streptomyces sp. NBC_01220 TaxID=2903781 RepID=UPI00352F9CD9